mmetsp:Transcript_17187/g.34227  ORF Transcript_17187/g.34227 Transcript_17187/m.34227 type:complete len:961 (+) Transcript_17187:728-3610(+)
MDMSPPLRNTWKVHKFGGTSVASAALLRRASSIVSAQLSASDDDPGRRACVVVSAMGGRPKATDLLLGAVSAAADRDVDGAEECLAEVYEKHRCCLEDPELAELLPEGRATSLLAGVARDLSDVRDVLRTVGIMMWKSERVSALVAGYGELWNAAALAAVLGAVAARQERADGPGGGAEGTDRYVFVDARRVVTTDEEGEAIDWEASVEKWEAVYASEADACRAEYPVEERWGVRVHAVVTGYVASTASGVPTTLGRDGSDYTAAIFGRLLQSGADACSTVNIWTDVDGVLSADPRRVPNVRVLPEVSYVEAMELAYFGAKVIHPKTMGPVMQCVPQVPIYIKNTFNPDFVGSRIYVSGTGHANRERCVAGFSSVDRIGIVDVEGSGLVGVPGVAKRLFGAINSLGVSVILIAQASSEHSITMALPMAAIEIVRAALEETFARELRLGYISSIRVVGPCSIIAAVGDGMSQTTGVAGRFFSALGDASINVLAVAQGSSERNISAVVLADDATRALRAVHAAFHLSHTYVRVGVVGGNTEVGMALLRLLEGQRDKLRTAFDIDLQVCAVYASGPEGGDGEGIGKNRLVVLTNTDNEGSDDSITAAAYERAEGGGGGGGGPDLARAVPGGGLAEFSSHLVSNACAHTIIFDCTADGTVAEFHAEWLVAGIHVVTANNRGLSGPRALREAISKAENRGDKSSGRYLPEVAAAGGLPVVSTLRSLLSSGDRIKQIDGIMSVSMSYIMFRIAPPPMVAECRVFDEGASKNGAEETPPGSPRNGTDGPCSFSMAVREAIDLGLMEIDPSNDLSNEYTARCLMVLAKELGMDGRGVDVGSIQAGSDVLELSDAVDEQMAARVEAAAARGCVPRQVATLDVASKTTVVRIMDVPHTHVFAVTPPSCECVRFFTKRHSRYPLIIQGPAMGVDSTASALLAEVLHLMQGRIGVPTRNLGKLRQGSSVALV